MNVVKEKEEHLLGLDHALDLAARGWLVVPYLRRADGAQVKNWPNIATQDSEQIEEWFGPGQPYEGCYVAVLPGLVGKTCVDFDAHESRPNGFETAQRLRLASTARVSFPSASGTGLHLWFDGASTSKAIYPGIDRKSIKGLVRVTYLLPDVEDVYELLPQEFRINDSAPTGREYLGSVAEWLESHSGKAASGTVTDTVKELPEPFVGHPLMLRVQMRLVSLAGEGHGGVPEALEEAGARWARAKHKSTSGSPELDWQRALEGAIVGFGGEPPKLTTDSHPDEFFEKNRLKSKTLAEVISYDLAVGPDGSEWLYESGVWTSRPDEIVKRTVRALGDRFNNSHSATMKTAVLHGIDLPRIRREADQENINLLNGMLEWRTGVLRPHHPDYLSTNQLPIEFQPEATCPNFDAWVAEVLPPDCHELLWESIGYLLMSGNPLQVALLFLGDGGNGKGTLLRLIEHMLGEESVSHVDLRDLSKNGFAMADLFGKIANIAGDIDAKFLDETGQFKQITGEDTVRAEKKFRDAFSFKPWAVPVFSANKMWRSSDDTDGYLRRWVIIPFPNKLDRSAGFDEESIKSEAPGILNKAIRHLRALLERGRFELSGAAADTLEEFRTQNDPVRMWLRDESVVRVGLANSRISRKDAYNSYKWWCLDQGYKVASSDRLYKALRREGFQEQNSNGQRYFVGICTASEVLGTGELSWQM